MHSDEFNGKAVDDVYCAKFGDCVTDPDNPIDPQLPNKRPNLPRSLTIDEAIEENKDSRVYLGVHWRFDQDAGGLLGETIAQNILANFPRKFI
ncbi:MAG: hypothetical protein HC767_12300 [Akkermansiaceae bacterium]|nr:hypothetical protein [Akkermansiaceae bacterium]